MAVAAAVTVALSACSSAAPVPELTGIRTLTVDSVPAWTTSPHDMRTQDFHDSGLIGPHYTLGVSWVATGRELDATAARQLGVHPIQTPKGRELVIAAVSPKFTRTAFKPSAPLPVMALVDGKPTPLQGLPLPDAGAYLAPTTKLIMISAVPHASLRLRVTDTGRSQELDLRTGATSGDGYRERNTKVTWKGESPIAFPGRGVPALDIGALSVRNAISSDSSNRPSVGDEAWLSNYLDEWAPPGKAFLTVPLPALSCSALVSGNYEVDADDSKTLSFTPIGGKTIRAKAAERIFPLMATTSPPPSSAVFTVPDNVTGGTVAFDLSSARLVGDNGSRSGRWNRAPHAFNLKLAFRR